MKTIKYQGETFEVFREALTSDGRISTIQAIQVTEWWIRLLDIECFHYKRMNDTDVTVSVVTMPKTTFQQLNERL